MIDNINSATTILLPSGRDHAHCSEVLGNYGVEVPAFAKRKLWAEAGGRKFAIVKGKDVPDYVARGIGDVGMTGLDVCEERIGNQSSVHYRATGQAMCNFELLFPESDAKDLLARIGDNAEPPVIVATGLPIFLGKCLKGSGADPAPNIAISPFRPSGSVEVLPALGVCEGVADLVETGVTAQANGLVRTKLAEVSPAIVWRDPAKPPGPLKPEMPSILGIDQAIARRVSQIGNPNIKSYTLERLRDPNKGVKKYGEEGAEYLSAVLGGEPTQTCEEELADLVYASLVAGNRQGRPVTLEGTLIELARRNSTSQAC